MGKWNALMLELAERVATERIDRLRGSASFLMTNEKQPQPGT